MGITNGRDLLSAKYPTAIIIDSVNTAHFVPIKNPVGDYFFVNINGELYAFDTKGETNKWRKKLAKTFEFKIYYTDCFVPLGSKVKEMEMILEKNELPRMSLMLHRVLSRISKHEKRKFEAIKMATILEDLDKRKSETPQRLEEYLNMITFIQDLSIDEIVTPVKRVTEYLDASFLAPDPKFMGSIRSAFETMDREDKIVNNVEISDKKGVMKLVIIMLVVVLFAGILYYGYSEGMFDDLTNLIPSFDAGGLGGLSDLGGGSATPEQTAFAKFPTPEAARAALDRGEVILDDFPEDIRKLIESVESLGIAP